MRIKEDAANQLRALDEAPCDEESNNVNLSFVFFREAAHKYSLLLNHTGHLQRILRSL